MTVQSALVPDEAPLVDLAAFDAEGPHFSLARALFFAKLSKAAYETQAKVEALANPRGWKVHGVISDPVTGTDGYVLVGGPHVIFLFRGTEPQDPRFRDFFTDGLTLPVILNFPFVWGAPFVAANWGAAHHGFLRSLASVWKVVEQAMADLQGSHFYWFAGHSLGGALACLGAGRFVHGGRVFKGAYTFGQPRVGQQAYCEALQAFNGRIFRTVNDEDIVPRLPPRLIGYTHCGQEHHLGTAAAWVDIAVDKLPVVPTFSALDRFDDLKGLKPLKDHDIDGYISKLQVLYHAAQEQPT